MNRAFKNLSPLLGAAWLCAHYPPALVQVLGRMRNPDSGVEVVQKEEPTKKAPEESAQPGETADAATGFEDAGWIVNYNVSSGSKDVNLCYDSSTSIKATLRGESADGKTVKNPWEPKHDHGRLSEDYLKNPSRSLPDFMPKDFFPYGQVWVNQLHLQFGKLGNVVLTNCYDYPLSDMVYVNNQPVGHGDSVLLITDDVVAFPGSLTHQQVRNFRVREEVRMRIHLDPTQQPLMEGEWEAYWAGLEREVELDETKWRTNYAADHRRVDVSELERRLPREAFVRTSAKWRGSKIDEGKTRYCRVVIESVDTDGDGGKILRGRRYLPGSDSKTRSWSHKLPAPKEWEQRDFLKKVFVSRIELSADFDRRVRAFLRERPVSNVIEGSVEGDPSSFVAEHGEEEESPSVEGDEDSDLFQYDWNSQRATRRYRIVKRLFDQMWRGPDVSTDYYAPWNWVIDNTIVDTMGTDDFEELDRWAESLEKMDPSTLEAAAQAYASAQGWQPGGDASESESTADKPCSRDGSAEDAPVEDAQAAIEKENGDKAIDEQAALRQPEVVKDVLETADVVLRPAEGGCFPLMRRRSDASTPRARRNVWLGCLRPKILFRTLREGAGREGGVRHLPGS